MSTEVAAMCQARPAEVASRERSSPVRFSLLVYIDSKRKMSTGAGTPLSFVPQGNTKTEGAREPTAWMAGLFFAEEPVT